MQRRARQEEAWGSENSEEVCRQWGQRPRGQGKEEEKQGWFKHSSDADSSGLDRRVRSRETLRVTWSLAWLMGTATTTGRLPCASQVSQSSMTETSQWPILQRRWGDLPKGLQLVDPQNELSTIKLFRVGDFTRSECEERKWWGQIWLSCFVDASGTGRWRYPVES